MDLQLTDLTVLITGASGGIGRALARTFAAEGCQLLLHAHGQLPALQAWVEGQAWADRALCVGADLRDPEAIDAAVRAGQARFGRVDLAVANAGAWPRPHALLHELPVARLQDTVGGNILGPAWTARATTCARP